MLKTNAKSQNKCFKFFNSFLPCYGTAKNRFFEGEMNFTGNQAIFDFGCKHKTKISGLDLKSNKFDNIVCKIINFETPYNEILVDFESHKKIRINDELFKLFKEKLESKTFLKGRFLNNAKKGFSIGACGLVGFLSLNNIVQVDEEKTMILQIESINLQQGIVSFSQKNMYKKTNKILAKLASKIVFIFESNSKIRQSRGLQGEYSLVVRALNCDFKSREFKSHYSPTIKNKIMNYKEKKYLSENKWLTEKLNNTEFFLLAQLKSCNSSEWIKVQKEFLRFGLKVKLVSFKNFNNVAFFSKLELKSIKVLFKGQVVLIYSEVEIKPSSSLINFIKSVYSIRPFLFYYSGRLINVNSIDIVKEIESFSLSSWNEVLNQLNGSSLCNTLNTFVDSCPELLQFQHKTLLNLLICNVIKNENEDKF